MTAATWAGLLPVGLLCAGATWLLTWLVRRWLLRLAVLDEPNARSSHAQAVPRGGGLAVVTVLLLAWFVFGRGEHLLLLVLTLGLAAMSWVDDLKGLSPLPRLIGQACAVAIGLTALSPGVFQGWVPPLVDAAVAGLLWLWFVNLYNFMDGIDGIAGVETAVIGIGVAAVGAPLAALHGASLAGAAVGFLLWNWHPARIFLGDVGSVAVGFLLGWLLLDLAAQGQWAAALLLPLYHLADATLTLARRLLRGERIWQAHRSHFYQRAAPAPTDHPRVSGLIGLLGLALIACAIWSMRAPLPALAAGGVLTALLLWWFGRARTA